MFDSSVDFLMTHVTVNSSMVAVKLLHDLAYIKQHEVKAFYLNIML